MDFEDDRIRNEIVQDFNSIIRELEQVAAELRHFQGLGMDLCSVQLIRISRKYEAVKYGL